MRGRGARAKLLIVMQNAAHLHPHISQLDALFFNRAHLHATLNASTQSSLLKYRCICILKYRNAILMRFELKYNNLS